MTEAWILTATGAAPDFSRGAVALPAMTEGDALVRPLHVGWEGNYSHAITSQPLDVLRARGEDRIVIGNNGVVELVETADDNLKRAAETCDGVFLVQPIFHDRAADRQGYLTSVFGYDMPGQMGLLARECVVPGKILIPLPVGRDRTAHWASFTIRYMTAWSLMRRAVDVHRAITGQTRDLTVFGWGGGTTLAALQLAVLQGHRAIMAVSGARKAAEAEALGITTIDRSAFPHLDFTNIGKEGGPTPREHRDSERAFLGALRELVGKGGADIAVDFIGEPTIRTTGKLMAKDGVLATSGWKHAPETTVNRAFSAVQQHTHVYCHHANRSEVPAIMEFALAHDWVPSNVSTFGFDDCAQLHTDFMAGRIDGYFPVVEF